MPASRGRACRRVVHDDRTQALGKGQCPLPRGWWPPWLQGLGALRLNSQHRCCPMLCRVPKAQHSEPEGFYPSSLLASPTILPPNNRAPPALCTLTVGFEPLQSPPLTRHRHAVATPL